MNRNNLKQFFRNTIIAIMAIFVSMPQQAGAQSLSNFKKAMNNGRTIGKPYWFDKDFGVDEAKAQKIARENNFVIIQNEGRRLKFVPKSEYDAYIAERDFTQRSLYYDAENGNWHSDYYLRKDNNYYDLSSSDKFFYDWYNKQLKGSDFKSTGSAWLLEAGNMIRIDNLRWTGAVKNGMLDGRGDGFIVREEDGKKTYRSFSGGFVEGIPNGEMRMLKTIYRSPGNGYPFKQSTEKYTVGNMSDGMASIEATLEEKGSWGSVVRTKKIGFIDQQGNLAIPFMYDEVKKDFVNGKATVKFFKDFDIIINKRNKCVEFPPNQESRGVIGRGYFTNAVFSELKQITIPKAERIESMAFKGMASLEEVRFPEGLRVIDSEAFMNCSSLKRVILPNSISRIGGAAFEYCFRLNSVSIPSTLKHESAKMVFLGCDNLKSITIRNPDGTATEDVNWLQEDRDILAMQVANRNASASKYAAEREQIVQKVQKVNASNIYGYIEREDEWKGSGSDRSRCVTFKDINDQYVTFFAFIYSRGDYYEVNIGLLGGDKYKTYADALVALYYSHYGMSWNENKK